MEAVRKKVQPRFNMPFELGLDLGCREYGHGRLRQKRCLILERKQFRYQKVLSDIAGHDIRAHQNDPQELVLRLRDWLAATVQSDLSAGRRIWQRFTVFNGDLYLLLKRKGFRNQDILLLETAEFVSSARDWIRANPTRHSAQRRATGHPS